MWKDLFGSRGIFTRLSLRNPIRRMPCDDEHASGQLPDARSQPSFASDETEPAMSDVIDLSAKLSKFSDHWSPRTVAQFNDCDVMVVKVQGEFVWHKHDDTDDFFLVLKGVLDIQLRDRTVTLSAGQMYIVPKGVQHRPVARDEVHLLLIEPTGTPNTGDAATAAPRKTA
jgi:mannose-6-phosphate isomerase-like protein (cupin superfamily)